MKDTPQSFFVVLQLFDRIEKLLIYSYRIQHCLPSDKAEYVLLCVKYALVRTSVLFFGRKQMRALIETTKQFWGMENYEAIVKRTRKGRITYIWITFSFVLSGCLKRHLNLSQTGLYYPRFFSKHVWVLISDLSNPEISDKSNLSKQIHDIAEEWGLLGFISYDILVRTLLIQITVQLEMLNKKLLVLYDSKEPESIIRNKLRECVEHYCLLMWFADGVNKLFSKAFLVTFASDIFSCTVSLYMIMGDADVRLLVEGALHIMAALYMLGFCYCIPAQDMDNEISDLSTNAYLSNWQNNIDYRKDILLVIRAMQIPFGISAGSIMPINMQTLLAACKAMVSYCMFLRTVDGSAN
ncbi:unnamed protein product [Acanthoscelides obtectus]|uniref:Odorant receptor n=1 Tax=Acanthoscelides obtectus TaxID=200917 RepID=A0A9P0KB48_ACAOB|nr:unnamed protein product [Acanthoscelides obtectus]CAK1666347.1 hypothetical protein AOBTE_LOCUS25269 [Acanthoscelides obtectus]